MKKIEEMDEVEHIGFKLVSKGRDDALRTNKALSPTIVLSSLGDSPEPAFDDVETSMIIGGIAQSELMLYGARVALTSDTMDFCEAYSLRIVYAQRLIALDAPLDFLFATGAGERVVKLFDPLHVERGAPLRITLESTTQLRHARVHSLCGGNSSVSFRVALLGFELVMPIDKMCDMVEQTLAERVAARKVSK